MLIVAVHLRANPAQPLRPAAAASASLRGPSPQITPTLREAELLPTPARLLDLHSNLLLTHSPALLEDRLRCQAVWQDLAELEVYEGSEPGLVRGFHSLATAFLSSAYFPSQPEGLLDKPLDGTGLGSVHK